jgi:hypothetical protein
MNRQMVRYAGQPRQLAEAACWRQSQETVRLWPLTWTGPDGPRRV